MIRISVCMATYNGERFIQQQIGSILSQLSDYDELVISDDSSSDETVSLIKEFDDHRIRLFEDQQFKSASRNFEFALGKCVGNFIFLADQDDIWLDGKLEIMLSGLQKNDLVVSDCQILNSDNSLHSDTFFHLYKSGKGVIKNCIKNTFLGNCMAFRKEVLSKALPMPEKVHSMPNLDHGMWIGIVTNLFYEVSFLPHVLLHYRRHDTNVSPTEVSAISPYTMQVIIASRVYLLCSLVKRYLR